MLPFYNRSTVVWGFTKSGIGHGLKRFSEHYYPIQYIFSFVGSQCCTFDVWSSVFWPWYSFEKSMVLKPMEHQNNMPYIIVDLSKLKITPGLWSKHVVIWNKIVWCTSRFHKAKQEGRWTLIIVFKLEKKRLIALFSWSCSMGIWFMVSFNSCYGVE